MQAQNALERKNSRWIKELNTKAGWQVQKHEPKMSKFTQKHAQISFCSTLKQQKCHKIKK